MILDNFVDQPYPIALWHGEEEEEHMTRMTRKESDLECHEFTSPLQASVQIAGLYGGVKASQ